MLRKTHLAYASDNIQFITLIVYRVLLNEGWMLKLSAQNKAGSSFNVESEGFIPAACHYDEYTLLTKNGELIQTIQVKGNFSQNIGDDLAHLRDIIRDTIKSNVHNDDFAFWVHTVRRKTNLDDSAAQYPDALSDIIHDMWREKNYWHDKFINTLYISIVYKKPELNILDISTIIKSLSGAYVTELYNKHFQKASETLNDVVNKILADLTFFGVERLHIKEEGGAYYSEPLFLLRRIIHLSEQRILLPLTDLAKALGTHRYAVGDNQIEVMNETSRKFASIISIKEYHEMPEHVLDGVLRLSLEFIVTEVFYCVPKSIATKPLEYSDYILKTSRDSDLRAYTLEQMMDASDESERAFCHQQISIMIMSDTVGSLAADVAHTSHALSDIGIVHVQEDINLEQVFWSQLPGNFAFLRRITPNIITNTAAFASLHNFPTGDATSAWGKAITLFRTEKGTPHFINFHNHKNVGHTIIFGPNGSGRIVMMNFLISEAMKFRPTIIYLTCSIKPKILLETIGGRVQELTKDKITINSHEILYFNLGDADPEAAYHVTANALECIATTPGPEPKILVLEDALCLQDERFESLIESAMQSITKNNGIILGAINLHQYQDCYTKPSLQKVYAGLGTEIILADDKKDLDLQKTLNLTSAESTKLKSFAAISRLFIVKQNNMSVVTEFSLGSKPGLMKMLSCNEQDVEIYTQVKAEESAVGAEWVTELYDKLSTNTMSK